MFTCIFCLKRYEDSQKTTEHIVPYSLGGSFTIDHVCKECNDKLGHDVDSHLINTPLIEGKRMIYKIKSRDGTIPNPLEKGVLVDDPEQKVKYIIEEGTPKSVYTVPRMKKEKQRDGTEIIKMTIDRSEADKIPVIIDKIKQRYGRKGFNVDTSNIKMEHNKIESPNVKVQLKFDTVNYHRALLKIAYEFTWYLLGDSYLNDKTARTMRDCIFDNSLQPDYGEKYQLRGAIGFCSGEGMQIFQDYLNYVILYPLSPSSIVCYIRIFSTFEGTIITSENEDIESIVAKSKAIVLNPIERTYEVYP